VVWTRPLVALFPTRDRVKTRRWRAGRARRTRLKAARQTPLPAPDAATIASAARPRRAPRCAHRL